jgi:hypothetical protein
MKWNEPAGTIITKEFLRCPTAIYSEELLKIE